MYSPTLLAKQTSYHTVLCVLSNSPGKTNIIPHCSLCTLQLSWQNKHHTTLFSVYSLTLLAKPTLYHTVLCVLSNSPGKTSRTGKVPLRHLQSPQQEPCSKQDFNPQRCECKNCGWIFKPVKVFLENMVL